MSEGRHLIKYIISHICANVRPIGIKYTLAFNIQYWRISLLALRTGRAAKISNSWKSKMADGHYFEKPETGHISAMVYAINTKFGTLMHIGPAKKSSSQNFQLLKIRCKMTDAVIWKNCKMVMTPHIGHPNRTDR